MGNPSVALITNIHSTPSPPPRGRQPDHLFGATPGRFLKRMRHLWRSLILRLALAVLSGAGLVAGRAASPAHTFCIGEKDFLVDGRPMQIRCGELHFARVPREYWRQRLQLCRAMGLNTVCAYLFWNFHEQEC